MWLARHLFLLLILLLLLPHLPYFLHVLFTACSYALVLVVAL